VNGGQGEKLRHGEAAARLAVAANGALPDCGQPPCCAHSLLPINAARIRASGTPSPRETQRTREPHGTCSQLRRAAVGPSDMRHTAMLVVVLALATHCHKCCLSRALTQRISQWKVKCRGAELRPLATGLAGGAQCAVACRRSDVGDGHCKQNSRNPSVSCRRQKGAHVLLETKETAEANADGSSHPQSRRPARPQCW
jgi:hypothetical protein